MPTTTEKTTHKNGTEITIEQTLQFHLPHETHHIHEPYSDVYGRRPSTVVFTGPIGTNDVQTCDANADPYTGLPRRRHHSTNDMNNHHAQRRANILARVLAEGAGWETSNADTYNNFLRLSPRKNAFKKK